jgi:hypothetical protein
MDEKAIIYMAGIVDGEGCLSIHMQGERPESPRITVGNNHDGLIRWIIEHFGVNDTYYEKKRHHLWRISGIAAIEFLKLVYPYLIVKKDQATLMLGYPTSRVGVTVSEEIRIQRMMIHDAIQKLNNPNRELATPAEG